MTTGNLRSASASSRNVYPVSQQLNAQLDQRISELDSKLDTLYLTVQRIEASIMPRNEVYAEDAKRVAIEPYEVTMTALRDRLTRLESGPQRLLGWISLIISGTVGCLSLVLVAVGVAATIMIAVIPHLH